MLSSQVGLFTTSESRFVLAYCCLWLVLGSVDVEMISLASIAYMLSAFQSVATAASHIGGPCSCKDVAGKAVWSFMLPT